MSQSVRWIVSFATAACLLLVVPRAAHATSYVGAFHVSDADAVNTLETKGFNLFVVTWIEGQGAAQDDQLHAVLGAINSGNVAIINLNGMPAATANALATRLKNPDQNPSYFSAAEYAKVVGYLTFAEANVELYPISLQKAWYDSSKQIAPDKLVFVGYHAEGSVGVQNMSYVQTTPNVAWNAVMVNYYPYQMSNDTATANICLYTAINTITNNIKSVFGTSSVIPIMQAAGFWPYAGSGSGSSCGVGSDRAVFDLSTQYSTWHTAGLMNISQAFVFYSWDSPDVVNLHNNSGMLDQAGIIANNHHWNFD